MGYRDELMALRARVEQLTKERDEARRELHQDRGLRVRARSRDASRWREWHSISGGAPIRIWLINGSARKLEAYWLSYRGEERSVGTLVPGGTVPQQSSVGHCWRFVDARTGEVLGHVHVPPVDKERTDIRIECSETTTGVFSVAVDPRNGAKASGSGSKQECAKQPRIEEEGKR